MTNESRDSFFGERKIKGLVRQVVHEARSISREHYASPRSLVDISLRYVYISRLCDSKKEFFEKTFIVPNESF
jgi:hypothetical protein